MELVRASRPRLAAGNSRSAENILRWRFYVDEDFDVRRVGVFGSRLAGHGLSIRLEFAEVGGKLGADEFGQSP